MLKKEGFLTGSLLFLSTRKIQAFLILKSINVFERVHDKLLRARDALLLYNLSKEGTRS